MISTFLPHPPAYRQAGGPSPLMEQGDMIREERACCASESTSKCEWNKFAIQMTWLQTCARRAYLHSIMIVVQYYYRRV